MSNELHRSRQNVEKRRIRRNEFGSGGQFGQEVIAAFIRGDHDPQSPQEFTFDQLDNRRIVETLSAGYIIQRGGHWYSIQKYKDIWHIIDSKHKEKGTHPIGNDAAMLPVLNEMSRSKRRQRPFTFEYNIFKIDEYVKPKFVSETFINEKGERWQCKVCPHDNHVLSGTCYSCRLPRDTTWDRLQEFGVNSFWNCKLGKCRKQNGGMSFRTPIYGQHGEELHCARCRYWRCSVQDCQMFNREETGEKPVTRCSKCGELKKPLYRHRFVDKQCKKNWKSLPK